MTPRYRQHKYAGGRGSIDDRSNRQLHLQPQFNNKQAF